MLFRPEDHQALQSMYHFRIKVDPNVEWGIPELVRELKIEDMTDPDPEQEVRSCHPSSRPSDRARSAIAPSRDMPHSAGASCRSRIASAARRLPG